MDNASSCLVEISHARRDLAIDMIYADARNFTGRAVYRRPGCFLHPDAAERLEEAIVHAARLGFKLKIFDAFRPSEAQWRLWQHTPDPDFLADPRRGSPHSRGVAVDLTLVDPSENELDMGTPFDAFTPRSHHGAPDVSATAHRNRLLLLGVMTTAGWDFYRNEWWHYQLFDARRYPLLSDSAAGTELMA
ncbi:MAG: D-alanyl-D-alanine dipeptidase [Alphaproteobacteria bacterium]|nr:D-alanyl-D-alanine dipeptidase [Alphaproteobacteria bacterium]